MNTALRDQIAAVLEEHDRKPARVRANLVVQLLDDLPATPTAADLPAPIDPPKWHRYASRLGKLLDDGIATTRNRTDAAMHALGLEPHEVRAVVIEPNVVHVFRWTDTSTRVGVGMPIVEEEAS